MAKQGGGKDTQMRFNNSNNSNIRGLLLELRHRNVGSMPDPKTGEIITWPEADQIVIYPWEFTKGEPRKYTISPDYLPKLRQILADAHWGAVVDLSLEDRKVNGVELVLDPMATLLDEIEL